MFISYFVWSKSEVLHTVPYSRSYPLSMTMYSQGEKFYLAIESKLVYWTIHKEIKDIMRYRRNMQSVPNKQQGWLAARAANMQSPQTANPVPTYVWQESIPLGNGYVMVISWKTCFVVHGTSRNFWFDSRGSISFNAARFSNHHGTSRAVVQAWRPFLRVSYENHPLTDLG